MIIEINFPRSLKRVSAVWKITKQAWKVWTPERTPKLIVAPKYFTRAEAQQLFEDVYPSLYEDAMKRFHEDRERMNSKIKQQTAIATRFGKASV